jgi:hypothetical protein
MSDIEIVDISQAAANADYIANMLTELSELKSMSIKELNKSYNELYDLVENLEKGRNLTQLYITIKIRDIYS